MHFKTKSLFIKEIFAWESVLVFLRVANGEGATYNRKYRIRLRYRVPGDLSVFIKLSFISLTKL